MQTSRWLRTLAAVALVAVTALPARLAAQGTTTAAITGTVTDSSNGQPVDAAQVQIVNKSTGTSVVTQTRPSGVYYLSGLAIGGPYTVTVRRIGFAPKNRDLGTLALGQRGVADFALAPQAATLAAITVQAGTATAPVINPNRRGTATLVDDSTLRNAPTLNRNFTDFMSTVPQITSAGPVGATSAGGVNNRYNNIQIDGGSANDLFGLGSTGQPGGQSNGKSISLDAVKEYQVLLSPYDLRYSNFTGALVNAVTKSGTNEFTGDAFYYFRNQNFAANVPFIQNSGLYVEQYGFSVGGPVIKDRLHFFVNGEWQARAQPSTGPYIGQASNAASPPIVDSVYVARFAHLLDSLGITPGNGGVQNNTNPLTNGFARLDLSMPEWNSTISLRDNYAEGSQDVFNRTSNTVFPLTGNSYTIFNKNNSVVGQINTTFKSGMDNELIIGYTSISDHRTPVAGFVPQITATVPGLQGGTVNLVSGAEQFSQGNILDQKLLEIKDNFSFFAGDDHRVNVGFTLDQWAFTNTFTESSYGVWNFGNLDSLAAGLPNRYRISLPLTPNDPSVIADPKGTTYGVYLMDNYTPSPRFNILFGLRLDIPVVTNHPPYTASFDSIFGPLFASMGREANTSQVPSGNAQLAPRLGFNWDVTGDSKNQVRGGIGVFSGRPVGVWVSNSWQNSGSGLGFVNCSNPQGSNPGPTPPFDPNSANQPPTCGNNAGFANGVVGPVDIMDKNLQYPEVLRANLAYDKELGDKFYFTFEALFTKGLNNFFYVNRNINYDSAYTGRDGRPMYGTIATNGTSAVYLYDASKRFSEVIDVVNQSGDYSYNLTLELQKRIASALDMRVAYTYSHSYDVQSLNSSRAISNWNFGRPGGAYDLLSTNTGISWFDQPNKLLISGTYIFPWKKWATDFSLIYQGYSGAPFDYTYTGSGNGRGDLNGDGNTNDLIYVPKNVFDPTEIQFSTIPPSGGKAAITAQTQALALYNLIQNTPCLKEHQGEILPRNSCRNPWVNRFDASINQSLPEVSGHHVTFRIDIFNLPNMLNGQWGRMRSAGINSDATLLSVTGMTAAVSRANPTAGIPIVQFQPAFQQYPVQNVASNYYQLQFSARFDW